MTERVERADSAASRINAALVLALVVLGAILAFSEVPQANQTLLATIVGALAGALVPRRAR